MRLIILLSFFLTVVVHAAPIETFKFDSEHDERLFHKLSEGLRCLVCQNEAIAESNADLAKDLRRQVYNMIRQGKSEDEIKSDMVQRYGDYVLFRPPFKPLTWLLWLGPTVIFFIALFYVIKIVQGQPQQEEAALSEEEMARINNLNKQTLDK